MISTKHKCVFVHIPKCGGQSVEDIFIRENGLSWETREPLLLRANNDPEAGPPRLAHLTYQEYLSYCYISHELMQVYTSFAIVRNPYRRAESLYRFLGYDCAIPFGRFLRDVLVRQLEDKGELYWFVRPQHEFVCDASGTVCVDQIIRLEELDEKMPTVLQQLDITTTCIPHINQSNKRSVFKYWLARLNFAKNGCFSLRPVVASTAVWDWEAVAIVDRLYQQDFHCFGYQQKVRKND